ncbi:hypothetical protein ACIOJ9_39450 [Streptomyces sp. NPDC088175]|uniref:hypothetical protein n=1 Tax=unclassified Streptomyces TaxID=2593676 RepID=UPI0037FA9756
METTTSNAKPARSPGTPAAACPTSSPNYAAHPARRPRRRPSSSCARASYIRSKAGAAPGPPGHLNQDGGWGSCSEDPRYPVRIWEGYFEARTAAQHEQHETWLASLTPQQRAEYEAENEADYWTDVAAAAQGPYDPYEDKYRFAEPDDDEPTVEDGYGPDDEYDRYPM